FGSHQFLAARECPISSPAINRVMARLLELEGCACPEAVEEIELFADAADERLLAWTFCARESDRQTLLSGSEAGRREVHSITGITFFPARRKPEDDEPPDIKPLARSGAAELVYQVQETGYRVSAAAFFQVNRYLVGDLVSTVTAGLSGELALDLYAGVG